MALPLFWLTNKELKYTQDTKVALPAREKGSTALEKCARRCV